MAAALLDTHVLLWMLDGTLPDRSAVAAAHVAGALGDGALSVSIGTFVDLRYLVDARRIAESVLAETERAIARPEVSVIPLNLDGYRAMEQITRAQVPDPFDRIIAATALAGDLPLVTADRRIRAALGSQAVWS